MNLEQLELTATTMATKGKGLLAADESTGTIKKRLDTINTESTEINRRKYRDMLFTAKDMEEYISGVIMYDETIRQSTINNDDISFSKFLSDLGVVPGIKVDMGAKPLSCFDKEFITEGLDGLRDRLSEYYNLGARFAKWRAVITISETTPTFASIDSNAHALARYASLCQEANIVPIVEPEILMDGSHSIDTSFDVTTEVLSSVFDALSNLDVYLEGIILKPNMVLSGYDSKDQATVEEVADASITCYQRTVPAAVPGIMFLSGGQSDILATERLNQMNTLETSKPWELSFSYGRALQTAAINAWNGKDENLDAGREAFLHRAKCNSLASKGKYSKEIE